MKSQHKDVKGKDSFVGKQKTGWSRDKREKNKVILGKKMEGTNPGRKDLVPTLTKWFSTFISINNRRKRGGHPSQPTHGNPKTYAPFSALRRHNSQPNPREDFSLYNATIYDLLGYAPSFLLAFIHSFICFHPWFHVHAFCFHFIWAGTWMMVLFIYCIRNVKAYSYVSWVGPLFTLKNKNPLF